MKPRCARGSIVLGLFVFFFGLLSLPIRADWQFAAGDADRDGKDDMALIGNGEWYVFMSGQNYAMEGPYDVDLTGGLYAVGDADGDRQADLAMLSGSDWFFWRSGNNYVREGPFDCGVTGGLPYLHDWDKDGKADPGVVIGHTWHVWDSGKDYAPRDPFGQEPPAGSEGIIPMAWGVNTNMYAYVKNGFIMIPPPTEDGLWLLYRIVQGIPVEGAFDDHEGDDLVVVQRHPDRFLFYTWFSGENNQKKGPYELRSGNAPGAAAMVWREGDGVYAAATVYDIADITNALVAVNGVQLLYNQKLTFDTSAGYPVELDLPFYYAALPGLPPGDKATFTVHTRGPGGISLLYRSEPTAVPGPVQLLSPADGAAIPAGDPVPMTWTEAASTRGYLVSYEAPDDPTSGDEGAWHIQYLPAPASGYTIPAGSTVRGPAEFVVSALNGDVDALLGSEDTNDFFLVTASWDEALALAVTPTPIPTSTPVITPTPPISGTVPLPIVKNYSIKEKGLRFKVRESDPYQMPYSGRVTATFKLRKRRVSAAFVMAYDMEGKPYFSWNKARIYKRKSKSYTVTFPVLPGSTIAIGTHKASWYGAWYSFGPGRFLTSRDMVVYPAAETRDFRRTWEGGEEALWSGITPGFLVDSGDYDGDGTGDLAVYRFSSGLWAARGITRAYFGTPDDFPVPGDYSGDGTTDFAVYRPGSGLWAVRGGPRIYFGRPGDLPVPGDYDGDGTADLAVFRQSSGLWAVRGATRTYFGGREDIPVPGYFTPDGRKTTGVFRPASGLWAIRGVTRAYFGQRGDSPVPGDYDGDWLWEPAVFRPASGLWAVRGVTRAYFGSGGGFPVPGPFAGDGIDRPGFFRPESGLWAIRALTRVYFGSGLDVPATR